MTDDYSVEPVIYQIYGGQWAASGIGWAVHADTKEQVIEKYWQTVELHREIDKRPYWAEIQAAKQKQKANVN